MTVTEQLPGVDPSPKKQGPPKLTERDMLNLLRVRHAKDAGNGPEYAYLEHVRDSSGFAAKRTCDALALHLWPSRGHELHGFEVKVSRSDWRRELAVPDKAEGWCSVVDRWWIVAPRGVVPVDEIPATWGLMETRGDGLFATKPAPLLRPHGDQVAIARTLLVPILRAAGAGLSHTPDAAALKAAEDEGHRKGMESAQRSGQSYERLYHEASEDLRAEREIVAEIQGALGGIEIGAWRKDTARAKRVADAIRKVLGADGAVERAEKGVERAATDLERAADHLKRQADDLRNNCGKWA